MYKRSSIVLAFMFLLLFSASSQAQEILLRKDNISSEVFLRIPPDQVTDVQQVGLSIVVTFAQPMRTPFSQQLNDTFIVSVNGQGTKLTVTFYNAADFAAVRVADGVRIIATRQRELDSVLVSYNLASPMLRKDNLRADDAMLDTKLRQYDILMQNGNYYQAAVDMETILATTKNVYYEQEAMFRLGSAQKALGPTDPVSYLEAASTFETFINTFPDNNKVQQARQLAAEASELGGSMFEAAVMYRAVYDNSTDAETKRTTLLKIAEIYDGLGQYDQTISSYEEYLANFQTDQDRIKTTLGRLYISRVREDDAYNMYSQVPMATLTQMLTANEVFALAKIFANKGDMTKAMSFYDYSANQEIADAPAAVWAMAEIYKAQGNVAEYQKALKRLMDNFPATQVGLEALIADAEQNYNTQTAAAWRVILDPIYNIEDTEGLVPRAEMVQIRALQAVNDVFPLVEKIDAYIEKYPEPASNARLLKIKEDVLFGKVQEYMLAGAEADNEALALIRQLLEQFPESPRVTMLTQYIDDIFYNRVLALFNAGDIEGTIATIEAHMIEAQMLSSPTLLAKRWEDLWEEAKFRYIQDNLETLPTLYIRTLAQEYLAYFPKGKYAKEATALLMGNFQKPYNDAYAAGNDAAVVRLYEANQAWLAQWPDQAMVNDNKLTVAKSLNRLGLQDQAIAMYKTITPTMTVDYAELGYRLCQDVFFDVNRLSAEQFSTVVVEAERCSRPDYTLTLINKYTANMPAALSAKYRAAKNITDDRRREAVLTEIYDLVKNTPANQFAGYEEVYLDMGLLAYQKNDFQGALIPLQTYVDTVAVENVAKRAEALYYIGKSLINMNERERGLTYFQQVVEMPDSIYKNMANNELEDEAWRNNNQNQQNP
jgi:TolA-binding protein